MCRVCVGGRVIVCGWVCMWMCCVWVFSSVFLLFVVCVHVCSIAYLYMLACTVCRLMSCVW